MRGYPNLEGIPGIPDIISSSPTFVDLRNMWLPLESWSVELRRLLSNSEGLTRYVQKAQRTFQRKFAARRILEDAQAPRRAHGGSRARAGDWREG